ncbi:MAG: hypothetical protein NT051_03075 [Candidatus Micrarchaeota archaeon]|nr:hypothetical protein [Candidatus Micrarchaeota archaeon]
MVSRKGQAALDFLMTYGWAIALVVIIAAVLFALGVFDTSNFIGSKASGFSGVAVTAWKLEPVAGAFTMKVANQVGQPIKITSINVSIGQNSVVMSNVSTSTLTVGETSGTLTSSAPHFGAQTSGSSYTAKVVIAYNDTNSGFTYTTAGTLTGKVSS